VLTHSPAPGPNAAGAVGPYLWRTGKGLEHNRVLEDLPLYLRNKLNVALNSENIKKVPPRPGCCPCDHQTDRQL